MHTLTTHHVQAYLRELHVRLPRLSFLQLAALPYIVVRLQARPDDSWWASLFSTMLVWLGSREGKAGGDRGMKAAATDGAGRPGGVDWAQLDTRSLTDVMWAITVCGQVPPQALLDGLMGEARARVAMKCAG
jgi:hypothetical protein